MKIFNKEKEIYIYDDYEKKFAGEPIIQYYLRFKIGKKNNLAQELCYDEPGGNWVTLEGKEKEELLKKLKEGSK